MATKARKILLVEDDPFLSALLRSRFVKEGFDVMHVKDGEEAINILRDIKADLMLLDIILPKKSGFEVMEAMKTDPQITPCPVMVISNLGQESDIRRGKELGAIEYFVKAQVSIDDLVTTVRDFFASQGQN